MGNCFCVFCASCPFSDANRSPEPPAAACRDEPVRGPTFNLRINTFRLIRKGLPAKLFGRRIVGKIPNGCKRPVQGNARLVPFSEIAPFVRGLTTAGDLPLA